MWIENWYNNTLSLNTRHIQKSIYFGRLVNAISLESDLMYYEYFFLQFQRLWERSNHSIKDVLIFHRNRFIVEYHYLNEISAQLFIK